MKQKKNGNEPDQWTHKNELKESSISSSHFLPEDEKSFAWHTGRGKRDERDQGFFVALSCVFHYIQLRSWRTRVQNKLLSRSSLGNGDRTVRRSFRSKHHIHFSPSILDQTDEKIRAIQEKFLPNKLLLLYLSYFQRWYPLAPTREDRLNFQLSEYVGWVYVSFILIRLGWFTSFRKANFGKRH